ncbi:MAG TPA: UDP-N-acetylmuramoyl-tripeptide--D-alanyl-D-alanine ligase [Fimbriimonadaceae bacterium]|nr:UDP-N-acetylmuramoyl-tripeptide--D-alanyl-D-alanine ligase [Fimbriimonadaceae bacterium]
MTVEEFARRCGGTTDDGAQEIEGFATDDRHVKKGDLFICIKGENVDGHDFADSALKKGAVACLCERKTSGTHILVKNIVEALAKFAKTERDEFHGPVVAVTGSTGKTTTKEMIAAALSPLGPVLKSEGNRNTEYTSPLVWADLTPEHKAVVVEMGMRGFGQIAHLASFAKPTIGVVTHIGTAHIEKVGSREGIVQAKSELLKALPKDGTAVLLREDDYFEDLKSNAKCNVRTFGFEQSADCRVLGYRALSWERCAVRGTIDGETFDLELPTTGRHQALNAACAVLVADTAGVKAKDAAKALADVTFPPMRLQVVPFRGATIVLDTYNASPDSTIAALKTLTEIPSKGRRLAILGEMKELGDFTESGHRLVGQALMDCPLDLVFLTGGPTSYIGDEARMAGFPAEKIVEQQEYDLSEVVRFLDGVRPGDTVLIKGSRALGLERALEALHT